MSFQAPYDIVGMRQQQMREAQMRQQQQMAMFEGIGTAIDNLVGGYMQREENKAKVKSGETMLKMFGEQMGVDPSILSSPEYKAMGLRGQSELHGNLWGSLGAISQLRIAGMNNQTRRDQQALTAAAPTIRTVNTNAAAVNSQGGPSLPGATRRFGN
jgi:hypothetical protein